MKNQLKQLYLNISDNYPSLGFYLRRFYKGYWLNRIQKKVRGRQNRIQYRHAVLSSVYFDIVGNFNTIEIGEGCVLENMGFLIRGDHHTIKIGKNCGFGKEAVLWFEDHHGALIIGQDCTFGSVHLAVTEPYSKITIGDDCMFAYDIDVRTGDSHSIVDVATGERVNFAKDITIGNHVWVGAHAILLKGVRVSDHSVIATGSVVTRSFEEKNVVISGNPAVVVKQNISWLRQRIAHT
jgi:acetyltransferase-like isoleucine patch superfamily enzyme